MRTLWDLIDPLLNRLIASSLDEKRAKQEAVAPAPPPPTSVAVPAPKPARPKVTASPSVVPEALAPRPGSKGRRRAPQKAVTDATDASMQAKYDAVVEIMLAKYQIRVRRWRSAMTGVAWYIEYRDGRRVNLIEAPKPRGPMSAAVFLHEIGHHAIGFDVYKPRCLEEFHAWRWSLEAMEAHGLNISDQVRLRMHQSLWYAVQKAKRRGIKKIPDELAPYLEKPPMRMRKRRR
jgi:hypothetical protein